MFVTINTEKITGALFADKNGREITVARGVKAPVVMTGFIGANEVKGEDGEYRPTAFGRLPVEAAQHDGRLVLSVAGGLRGVLFKADKEGAKYDYSGNIEAGDGTRFPIFGSRKKGPNGTFVSLYSLERETPKEKDAKDKPPAPADEADDGDLPF